MPYIVVIAVLIASFFCAFQAQAEATDRESPGCFEPFHNIGAPQPRGNAAADVDFYRHSTGKGGVGRLYRADQLDTYGVWLQRLSLLGLSPNLKSSVSG